MATDSKHRLITVQFVSSEEGYKLLNVETVEYLPDDLGINIDTNIARIGLTLAPTFGDMPTITGLDIIRSSKGIEGIEAEARAARGRCTSVMSDLLKRPFKPLR